MRTQLSQFLSPAGARALGAAAGGSTQAGGPTALDRAKEYAEGKNQPSAEREQQEQQRLNLSFYAVGSGLASAAEARIQEAIAGGALQGLKGQGKPLSQEDHTAQFGRIDPMVAAVTRTMGAQNIRPQSLELRDELRRQLAQFRSRLRLELQAGQQQQQQQQQQAAASLPSPATRSSTGGWLSRLLGGSSQTSTVISSNSSSSSGSSSVEGQCSVDDIRQGRHAGLQHDFHALQQLLKQYNSAVLSDKESYGPQWPLEQQRRLDFTAEVQAQLLAISCGSESFA